MLSSDEYTLDFACWGSDIGRRGEEVRALACRISAIPPSFEEVVRGQTLRKLIHDGHYNIVHSHMFNLSGWLLRHAHAEGVSVRIAHFHNTGDGRRWWPGLFLRRATSREVIRRHANALLACSQAALANAPRLRQSLAARVVTCGIDTTKYKPRMKDPGLRKSLGIRDDAAVIGHVGRFVSAKNHKGLIEILKLVRSQVHNAYLVLVGDGPMKPSIERQVAANRLSAQVRFLGSRTDVQRILPAFDVFCFPSVHEGLPLAVLEARMSGVPVVASAIAELEEAIAGCNGCALVGPVDYRTFASRVVNFLNDKKHISPPEDWASRFSRERSANQLAAFYAKLMRAAAHQQTSPLRAA